MAAIEKKDVSQARQLLTDFDAELRRVKEESKDGRNPNSEEAGGASDGAPKIQVMPDAMLHPLLNYLSVMSLELRASLATVEAQSDEANKLFAQAEQQEKGLGYREPPVYVRPVAETDAAARVAIGDWSGAKEAYRHALQRRPRSGFARYGIAMRNEKLGDTAAASQEYAEFLAAWKYADTGLAEVTHAQNFIAEHPSHAALSGGDHSESERTARSLKRIGSHSERTDERTDDQDRGCRKSPGQQDRGAQVADGFR